MSVDDNVGRGDVTDNVSGDNVSGADVDTVVPADIRKGDVIADPVTNRWMTVNEIQLMEDAHAGTYRFFGDGPDDRVAFEENEQVTRRVR